MAESQVRFGILGCANIARKNARAIILSPNAALYAIGSCSIEKAKAFAAANGFPPSAKIYGSYQDVLDDPNVDAVYVPLPTSLHLHWAVLAAQKKKHVLLEKPVALNVKELETILHACESNGVQFMDATMWMHHPRTAKMKEFLSDSDLFGELKAVHSIFSLAGTPAFLESDIRMKPDLDALGSLGDLGWYTIRAILWLTDFELPNSVIALPDPSFNKAGVILSWGASLHWEDGRIGTFRCSFLENLTTNLVATGTKGTLFLNDFVVPFKEDKARYSTSSRSWINEIATEWVNEPIEETVVNDVPQEVLMVSEFSRLVLSVKNCGLKPDEKWGILSKKTMLIVDAVKASIDRGSVRVAV